MDVVHTYCAGLDVHKKTVVTAVSVPDCYGPVNLDTERPH